MCDYEALLGFMLFKNLSAPIHLHLTSNNTFVPLFWRGLLFHFCFCFSISRVFPTPKPFSCSSSQFYWVSFLFWFFLSAFSLCLFSVLLLFTFSYLIIILYWFILTCLDSLLISFNFLFRTEYFETFLFFILCILYSIYETENILKYTLRRYKKILILK